MSTDQEQCNLHLPCRPPNMPPELNVHHEGLYPLPDFFFFWNSLSSLRECIYSLHRDGQGLCLLSVCPFLSTDMKEKRDQKVEWESKDLQFRLSLADTLCCLVSSVKQMFHHWKAQFLLSELETILLGQDTGIFVKEIQQSSPFHEAYFVLNQRKTNHSSSQPGSSCRTKYFKQVRNNIWTWKLAMKLQMISMKNDYL